MKTKEEPIIIELDRLIGDLTNADVDAVAHELSKETNQDRSIHLVLCRGFSDPSGLIALTKLIKEHGSNIKALDFKWESVGEQDIAQIVVLTSNLHELSFPVQSCNGTERIIQAIPIECRRSLKSLTFRENDIMEEDLMSTITQSFCMFLCLKEIHLDLCKFSDDSMSMLVNAILNMNGQQPLERISLENNGGLSAQSIRTITHLVNRMARSTVWNLTLRFSPDLFDNVSFARDFANAMQKHAPRRLCLKEVDLRPETAVLLYRAAEDMRGFNSCLHLTGIGVLQQGMTLGQLVDSIPRMAMQWLYIHDIDSSTEWNEADQKMFLDALYQNISLLKTFCYTAAMSRIAKAIFEIEARNKSMSLVTKVISTKASALSSRVVPKVLATLLENKHGTIPAYMAVRSLFNIWLNVPRK